MQFSDDALLAQFPPAPRSLTLRDLQKRLDVDFDSRDDLRAAVRNLVSTGKVEHLGGSRYGRAMDASTVLGTLTVHPRGFGFVALDGEGDDVYIDGANLGTAMHRDRVRVRIQRSSGTRTEGVIVSVADRGTHTFVGIFREGARRCVLHPQDARLPEHIPCDRARGVRDGDRVAAKFVRFPDDPMGALAEVVKVFENDGDTAKETDVVVYDLGLRVDFPPEVEAEARGLKLDLAAVLADRRDLRDRALVTIDPESARDFDDALHAEPRHEGGWRVTVAIADVSHYVTEGSALDAEAVLRGTSIYFPDRVIPMLPHEISNDLCSLRPNEPRLAMVAEFDVLPDGEVGGAELYPAVICSHARFTYDRAARMLGLFPGTDGKLLPPAEDDDPEFEDLRPELIALRDATRARRRWRAKRGYLVLEIGEPKVMFDTEGQVEDVRPAERHEAHMMVEDAMLIANEVVANWFVSQELPSVFRVHDNPVPLAMARFKEQALALGAPYKHVGKPSPQAFNKYLQSVREHPLSMLLNSLLLRSMAKAVYDEEAAPHFGLGAPEYLHFTSPIRRYPDLYVHRLLKAAWAGKPVVDEDAIDALAEHCSRRERVAVEAERSVFDMYKAHFLVGHVGETFDGVVINAVPLGLFVQLQPHMVEGLVHVDRLPGGSWRFDRDEGAIFNRNGDRLGLGDRLRVEVSKVDVLARRVELTLVSRLPR